MQVLNTDNGSYVFDVNNPDLTLKKNGKFSSVYIGYTVPEKQRVVIKIMNPALLDDQASIIRFHKEALKSFEHPSLQKTIDAYSDDSGSFLIKEYVDGVTLSQLYRNYKIADVQFYMRCTINLLKILEALHEKEIVHCDIRPQNILLLNDKETGTPDLANMQIVLLDLGLAKTPETESYTHVQPFSLIYSPPEQLLNRQKLVNHSSDTYAAAIVLYECITATLPFIHENPEIIQHMQLNTALLHNKNIPPPLFEILKKATYKQPLPLPPSQYSLNEIDAFVGQGQLQRYKSATAFKHALMDCLDVLEKAAEQPEKKGLLARWLGK